MAEGPLRCPYVGLRPFHESDYAFFFGRDREIRVISSNLQSQPLTVLYGPSGVGKSSVLQAGVLPRLRNVSNHPIVYFNEWQSPSFLSELDEKCRRLIATATLAQAPASAQIQSERISLRFKKTDEPLDDALEQTTRFFLLLDQFEEFLAYHPEGPGREFEAVLARIVNREDVQTNVLIGIREDALAKLDQRFGMRIPNLLGNTLEIEHLDAAAAREAILQPIAVLNQDPDAGRWQVESELVDEVLRQLQSEEVRSDSLGSGPAAIFGRERRIETAFLQLVLMRLWNEELLASSHTLRSETLSKIGGAGSIVQKHVDSVMAQLSGDHQRNIDRKSVV